MIGVEGLKKVSALFTENEVGNDWIELSRKVNKLEIVPMKNVREAN